MSCSVVCELSQHVLVHARPGLPLPHWWSQAVSCTSVGGECKPVGVTLSSNTPPSHDGLPQCVVHPMVVWCGEGGACAGMYGGVVREGHVQACMGLL